MRNVLYILLALTFAVVSYSSPKGQATDSVPSGAYTLSHIQEVAMTDYEEAMRLADEGLRSGQLSAYTAHTLRARLTYLHTENYAAAAGFMRKALELEEARDPAVRTQLLYHLATVLRSGRDFTELLATCTQGKECAHKAGKAFEENAFDFLVGNALVDIGEEDDGFEMMCGALKKASSLASSEDEYGHLIYFYGQYLNDLQGKKDWDAVLSACTDYEKRVSDMERSFPGMDSSYIDRCRFYLDIHRAIGYSYTGSSDSALQAFEKACTRSYCLTTDGQTQLVDYYAAAGQPDKILDIYRDELPFTEPDTVSRSYRMRIARLLEACTNAGMSEKAREYQEIYNSLSRQLEQKERFEGTFTNSAKYDVQRYRFKLEDTTRVLRQNQRLIFVLITIFILATGLLLVLLLSRNRAHRQESESLKKSLSSIQRQVSIIADMQTHKDASDAPEAALTLKDVIEGRELYLDKGLNRQKISAILGKSPYEIDKMLADAAPGISFPDYIKGLRIRRALDLLSENPDISIAELADSSGFYTVRSLQRSFLAIIGKTPSEFAKDLKK